ncbi:hypothetical protein PYW08_016047 [Mythimna loreyi]|uniref:Uncharacterized protein n=1 Tax=Mythimna loreyi TaxID=667449 RepID=A0ACC2QXK5_9NEOP|nr:hypothetical protein PYW08_016047 [Mythimna loreyi]
MAADSFATRISATPRLRELNGLGVQLITTVQDKLLLKYKGHYYSKTPYLKKRWRCINTNNCYVGVIVNNDFSIIKEPGEHCHPPKIYVETEDGKYKLIKENPSKSCEYIVYEY